MQMETDRTLEALIDILERVRRRQKWVGVQTLRAHFGMHVYTLGSS